jgi:ribose transport system permease protein/ribose transport system ATP-binding protein
MSSEADLVSEHDSLLSEGSVSAAGRQAAPVRLRLTGISKAFAGVQALSDVSLTCFGGEIHALVGENGAGKSTLIKIASGLVRPDTGSVEIDGAPLVHSAPREARRLGLLTAYQDTSLVPQLTARENLILSLRGVRKVPLALPRRQLAELVGPYELPFPLDARVADLSVASRQRLEIVRAHMHHPRVLVLDEPTAALDRTSAEWLERLLLSTLHDGTAILYITHHLDEVRRLANRLTVLRDGRIEGSYQGRGWGVNEIVSLMVGTATELTFPPKSEEPAAATVAELRDFSGDGFGPVSLVARAGEVVGIAGAEGNGQRDLIRGFVGLRRTRGEFLLQGRASHIHSPRAAAELGVSFQSGDRVSESMFSELSVMANGTAGLTKALGPLGTLMRSRQLAGFKRVADQLGAVYASPDQPVSALSGGNQQKVVLSRGIGSDTRLWVVDEPTLGVDARARMDIYDIIRGQASAGSAVLVNSSDGYELAGLCDRVYVLSRGVVVRELAGEELSEEAIVASFVDTEHAAATSAPAASEDHTPGSRRSWLRARRFPPLLVLMALFLAVGAYAAAHSPDFLSTGNIGSLLAMALPVLIVALGQQFALLAGQFDISVGSAMSVAACVGSFWLASGALGTTVLGLVGCLAIGVAIGLLNSFIIRGLNVSPVIATIATLGILAGVAILIRPTPGGGISVGLTNVLTASAGFVPVFFAVAVVVGVVADLWRTRTCSGLFYRAVGLSEEAALRSGLAVTKTKVVSHVVCSVLAVVAGIFLLAQVTVATNNLGTSFPLLAFTACFLGGAALSGGRGVFLGVVLGAVFLGMLTNIAPLLGWPAATSTIMTGVLTLVAVTAYAERRRGGWRRRTPSSQSATLASSDPELVER